MTFFRDLSGTRKIPARETDCLRESRRWRDARLHAETALPDQKTSMVRFT
jgi:hypothetical protein